MRRGDKTKAGAAGLPPMVEIIFIQMSFNFMIILYVISMFGVFTLQRRRFGTMTGKEERPAATAEELWRDPHFIRVRVAGAGWTVMAREGLARVAAVLDSVAAKRNLPARHFFLRALHPTTRVLADTVCWVEFRRLRDMVWCGVVWCEFVAVFD